MDITPYNEDNSLHPVAVLLLLLLLMMLGSGIGSGLSYLLTEYQGVELRELMNQFNERSSLEERSLLRAVNLFSQLFSFTLPALLLAYLLHRRKWAHFLQLDQRSPLQLYALGILFIFGLFVLSQAAYWLNQQLPLPDWADDMEGAAARITKGLLVMNSPGELIFNLLVIAVLPAVGEELVFRGIVQRSFEKATRRPALAIWLAALTFSAFHLQFAGLFPRLLLGAGLGYLFLWTRNLWVPILAHFTINSMQIIGQYLNRNALPETTLEEVNWLATAVAGLLVAGLSYYLYRRYKSRFGIQADDTAPTPLP